MRMEDVKAGKHELRLELKPDLRECLIDGVRVCNFASLTLSISASLVFAGDFTIVYMKTNPDCSLTGKDGFAQFGKIEGRFTNLEASRDTISATVYLRSRTEE